MHKQAHGTCADAGFCRNPAPDRSGELSRRSALAVLAGGVAAGALPASWAVAASPLQAIWPGTSWRTTSPATAGFSKSKLDAAISFARRSGGAGFIVRSGWQVASWGDSAKIYRLYSATKGFGSMLFGLALGDGRLAVSQRAQAVLPEIGVPPNSNQATGWLDEITLEHLLAHSAGFPIDGGFHKLAFRPGTYWLYSNGGPNWLADVMTVRMGQDLDAMLRSRILGKIGLSSSQYYWRKNTYRPDTIRGVKRREFGSGIHMNARSLARVGLLLLRDGTWQGTRVLPSVYMNQAFAGRPDLANIRSRSDGTAGSLASYWMYMWGNNGKRRRWPDLPTDTIMFLGKYHQHLVIVPSLDLVMVRLGDKYVSQTSDAINDVWRRFVAAVA